MKRWYLYPFSLVYHFVTAMRNRMYDWGIFSSTKFKTPIIGVGNLSVGGSGKSPMVMYMADLLSKNFRTGVLSRGYGRKTKGYGIVNYDSTYKMVGDEAMQLFERFRNRFVIGVCEDRVFGARKIIDDMDLDVLLLDDSYQHRRIKPGFNILLTDYNDPYFKDFLLPAGNLRESRRGAKRADLIVVTKCPEILTEEKKQFYINKIKPRHYQKVFFSSINYDENVVNKRQQIPVQNLNYYDILLVTGIANPSLILKELQKYTPKIKHLKYGDHHSFTLADIDNIKKEYQKLGEYRIILTTEKDFVRLKSFDLIREKNLLLAINVEIDRKEEFDQIIENYVRKIKQTADFIKNIIQETPDFAIVLGSGLGKLQEEVEAIHTLEYHEIPNFPQTTVAGHGGKLIYGILEGKKVLMMSGRFHYYEGHDIQTVTFPFRVFKLLGIQNLIVSNASGGVNPNFRVADIMIIEDHINMMPEHPLRGKNLDELGPRFVDMSEPYNRKMIAVAEEVAKNLEIKAHKGVYLALQGPTFETPAEYGMVRAIGGDAVGMSTVPEVIVAKHMGMDCFGISIITDVGDPEIAFTVSHEEVLEAANKAMPNVIKLVKGLVKNYQ